MDFFPGLSPITQLGKITFENKILRNICLSIAMISFCASIAVVIFGFLNTNTYAELSLFLDNYLRFTAPPVIVVFILYFFSLMAKTQDIFQEKLDELKAERKEITNRIESKKELDIFYTIQLSLNQVNEYYTINKSQAVSSFKISAFAIIFGLLTILAGIWFYYLGHEYINLIYISGVSGLLLEFIGGAYFLMYKRSLEQVNFFFGQLIKIQDTMLAIKLSESISIEDKKVEMHEKIIVSLLERSLK